MTMTNKIKKSGLRILLVAGMALLQAGAVWADFNSSAIGTSSAEFLQLAPGARAAALGEAYSAVANEASAVYWNPAALTLIEGRSLIVTHAPYLGSSFLDYAAYGQNFGKSGALGVGVQYFSAGQLTRTENYIPVGNFTPYDLAVSAGYGTVLRDTGLPLDGFAVGVTGKFIQCHILNSGRAEALDLGALSPAYLGGRLRLAFTATNLGGTLKYDQISEDLPAAFRLGGVFGLVPGKWLVSADAVFARNDRPSFGAGTEYTLVSAGELRFSGRAGYNSRTASSVTGFNGASFGAGAGFGRFDIDYAFVPFGSLGQTHRISLNAKF